MAEKVQLAPSVENPCPATISAYWFQLLVFVGYTCERRCQCPRLSNHTLGSSHTVLGRGCAPGVNINLPCVNGAPLMRSAIEMRIPGPWQNNATEPFASSNGDGFSQLNGGIPPSESHGPFGEAEPCTLCADTGLHTSFGLGGDDGVVQLVNFPFPGPDLP